MKITINFFMIPSFIFLFYDKLKMKGSQVSWILRGNILKSFFRLNEKVPALIVNRTVSILFAVCFVIVLLYLFGAARGFPDQTLLIILNFSTIFGALLLVSSFFGLVFYTIIAVMRKKLLYLGRIFLFLILTVFGGVISSSAYFLIIMSEGNRIWETVKIMCLHWQRASHLSVNSIN